MSRPDSFWAAPDFDEQVERLCRQAWQSRVCPDCGRAVYKTHGVDGVVFVACEKRCGFGFYVREASLGPWSPSLRVVRSSQDSQP